MPKSPASIVRDGIQDRRIAALDLANDPYTAASWAAAYMDYASACERLMLMQDKATMKDGPHA